MHMLTDEEVLSSITCIKNLYKYIDCLKYKKDSVDIVIPAEALSLEYFAVNENAMACDEKGIAIISSNNYEDKFVWLNDKWCKLGDLFSLRFEQIGWNKVSALFERLLALLLTQVDYYPNHCNGEVPYACSSLSDSIYIYCSSEGLLGMCSLKLKGTSVWGDETCYPCDTLDIIYVRPLFRRKGYALELLNIFTHDCIGNNIGVASPISNGMLNVLFKFIVKYPNRKNKLLIIDEEGKVNGGIFQVLPKYLEQSQLFYLCSS